MYTTLEDTVKPITLLLKGPPGSGKTTKAAHFPNAVLFNFDNNLSGLRKLPEALRKSLRIVSPRLDANGKPVKPELVWNNFVTQLSKTLEDKTVQTVIIDSMTTLAEVLMDKILGSGDPSKRVEIQHWGDFQRYLKWLGEDVLCANDLDKHVIFIAHEQIEKDEAAGTITYTLNFGGRLRNSFDLFFTDCWRCYVKPSAQAVEYRVRTLPAQQFNAKCSLSLPIDFDWDKEKDNVLKQISAATPSV